MDELDTSSVYTESLRQFYRKGITRDVSWRLAKLKELKKSILSRVGDINRALWEDLRKSEGEAYLTEIGVVVGEIDYHVKHLKRWARGRRVATPLPFLPSRSRLMYEPYGVVLVISPWNYPFQLLLEPLVGALSAGNCVVLKPSPHAPATAKVVGEIVSAVFDSDHVCVCEGDGEMVTRLLSERFDYIFFTGGARFGREVMEVASRHLTPVTLELGGKSPCIIDRSANIEIAARRIAWGKFLNAGQTCVAPDYVLAHESICDKLIEQMKKYIVGFYGERPLQDGNYPKIINEKHYDRLASLVEASNVIYGGGMNPETCQIEPTLIQADWDSEIMKDEIFGPLLPVLKFSNLKDRPKPLALYYFTTSAAGKDFVTRNISYGGGCINDTIVHLANPNIPFGGVGASGMGSYHGKESFKTFSHRKSVLEKKNWLDLPIRYAPNSPRDLKLLKFLMK